MLKKRSANISVAVPVAGDVMFTLIITASRSAGSIRVFFFLNCYRRISGACYSPLFLPRLIAFSDNRQPSAYYFVSSCKGREK